MLTNKGKIEGLQILRAIAFLEIFLGHCGVRFFTGAFGVSIFMVLSGFCMAINYLPKIETMKVTLTGNIKFALSKVKKLYGLHLIMLAVAWWFAKMPTSAQAWKKMILDVFLLQSFSPHSETYFSFNGVAWYLSVYLFVCLFALWIIKGFSKCKSKYTVLGICAVIYGLMAVLGYAVTKKQINIGDNFAYWFTYVFPGYRLLDFTLGAAFGWLYLHREEFKVSRWMMTLLEAAGVAAFVLVILIFHKIENIYPGLCYTVLFTPVSLLLVMIFAGSNGWIMRILNNPLFRWIGNISSYTFLIHQMPIRYMGIYCFISMTESARVICIILISFAISAVGAELFKLVQNRKWMKRTEVIN